MDFEDYFKAGRTVGTNKIKSYTSALIYALYHIINGIRSFNY